jgi:hypothetical protein
MAVYLNAQPGRKGPAIRAEDLYRVDEPEPEVSPEERHREFEETVQLMGPDRLPVVIPLDPVFRARQRERSP